MYSMKRNDDFERKDDRVYQDYSIGYDPEAVEYDLQCISRLTNGRSRFGMQSAQKIYYRIQYEDIHFKSTTGEDFLAGLYENMTEEQIQEINRAVRIKRQKRLSRKKRLRINGIAVMSASVLALVSSVYCMNRSMQADFHADEQTENLLETENLQKNQMEKSISAVDSAETDAADRNMASNGSEWHENQSAGAVRQIPDPEMQDADAEGTAAMQLMEAVNETDTQKPEADDNSVHTVTFSMNGGKYSGDYNNYSFKDRTPVLVVDSGDVISCFPDEQYASYAGYQTEKDTWYTDKECLNRYDKDSRVTKSITLYKKWYSITSDGSTPASKGFYISPDGKILYKYDGDDRQAVIPQTVTTIAEGAFDGLGNAGASMILADID